MKKSGLLILLLATTLSGDTMLTVGLIWSALKVNGSEMVLALALVMMSVVPYVFQKLVPSVQNLITSAPLYSFSVARGFGIIAALGGLVIPDPVLAWELYIMAGIFTVIIFITQQSLETALSNLVLDKKIDAKTASRILQGAIQLGAFIGATVGGMTIETTGLKSIFVILCGTFLIGALILRLLKELTKELSEETSKNSSSSESPVVDDVVRKKTLASELVLWSALVGIGVLAIQLGSFNYLIPIIFQKLKLWHAFDYGIVSASAGVGALLATTSLLPKRILNVASMLCFIAIGVLDVLLAMTNSVFISSVIALLLGFCFNTARISQRVFIYESVSSKGDGAEWAGRSTLIFQVIKSVAPLVLGLTLTSFGVNAAENVFITLGILMVLLATVLVVYQRNLHSPRIKVAK